MTLQIKWDSTLANRRPNRCRIPLHGVEFESAAERDEFIRTHRVFRGIAVGFGGTHLTLTFRTADTSPDEVSRQVQKIIDLLREEEWVQHDRFYDQRFEIHR